MGIRHGAAGDSMPADNGSAPEGDGAVGGDGAMGGPADA